MVLHFYFFPLKTVSWCYEPNQWSSLTHFLTGMLGWYTIMVMWHTLLAPLIYVILFFFQMQTVER